MNGGGVARSGLSSKLTALVLPLLAFASTAHPISAGHHDAALTQYYVSIGDSYAAGYQPVSAAMDGRDTSGFAYRVVALARQKERDYVLRNFACDGATSTSVLHDVGCPLTSPGPDDVSYPTRTQAAAAEAFISGHRGQVGLITVSLGGNDVIGCGTSNDVSPCFRAAIPRLRSELTQLVAGLRSAAGPDVPIIGLTYPDVFLGLYTTNVPEDRSRSRASVSAFEQILNPTLNRAYLAGGASFVDVTRATDAYVPFTTTVPFGRDRRLPLAVAAICRLTYYCSQEDVHPSDRGYLFIARLILATLGSRSGLSA